MLSYEEIRNLSIREIIALRDLADIAIKAEEYYNLIRETYLFHIGEESIDVWLSEVSNEYLTQDGVWHARYLNQSYDIKCTVGEIFDHMRAIYLIERGYVEEFLDGVLSDEGEKKVAFKYFEDFLHRTAKKREYEDSLRKLEMKHELEK